LETLTLTEMKFEFAVKRDDRKHWFFAKDTEFVYSGHYALCFEAASLLPEKQGNKGTLVITSKRPHHRKALLVEKNDSCSVNIGGECFDLGWSQERLFNHLEHLKKVWVYIK
jgi:hypothetical protein